MGSSSSASRHQRTRPSQGAAPGARVRCPQCHQFFSIAPVKLPPSSLPHGLAWVCQFCGNKLRIDPFRRTCVLFISEGDGGPRPEQAGALADFLLKILVKSLSPAVDRFVAALSVSFHSLALINSTVSVFKVDLHSLGSSESCFIFSCRSGSC